MMTLPIPPGQYFLLPGISLVSQKKGGIILQESPLRVIKVNETAFAILKACRQGFSVGTFVNHDSIKYTPILNLLDSLCRWRIIAWQPKAGDFYPLVSIVIPVYQSSS